MGGKVVRHLSRVSVGRRLVRLVGLCLLLQHHANPSQERVKQKTLGITGELHKRLFTKRRNFKEGISKEELGQFITLLSIAFALSQM